jgi:hypothetical protein
MTGSTAGNDSGEIEKTGTTVGNYSGLPYRQNQHQEMIQDIYKRQIITGKYSGELQKTGTIEAAIAGMDS